MSITCSLLNINLFTSTIKRLDHIFTYNYFSEIVILNNLENTKQMPMLDVSFAIFVGNISK